MLNLENDNKLMELRARLERDEMTTRNNNEVKDIDTNRVNQLIGNYHDNKLNNYSNTKTVHSNSEKKDVVMNNVNLKNKNPQRMEIWYYDFGKGNGGCTQFGIRPCLISSNVLNNKYSTIRNVFPITSKTTKADIPVHVKISTDCGLKEDSVILTEQITTIDIRCGLLSYVGKVSELTMKLVDRARNIQLGEMVEKSPLEKLSKEIQDEINETLQCIYSYEKVLGRSKSNNLNHLLSERSMLLNHLERICKANKLNYKDYYKEYTKERNVAIGQ